MGVIQSSVNQAIGAAGQAAGFVKFLGNQKELSIGQKNLEDVSLMEPEEKQAYSTAVRDAQLEQEEKAKLIAKIREQMYRERERKSSNERQSTLSKIRNMKEQKDYERLHSSVLGGDLNG